MPAIDLKTYRVRTDSKVALSHWSPSDDGGITKADGELLLQKNLRVLEELQMKFWASKSHSLLIVLQGIDTAGKDGIIRRVITGMNPQGVAVHAFKKPTDAEAGHDYLWRVHSRCPSKGEVGVFNRSHYEDIIFGSVHGLLKSSAERGKSTSLSRC
ncbi:MAG: hypothetical protein O2800_07955 [Planctomycetota bacterium]|nr:hypothetical protein [Planctomycetota bacterium]